MENRQLRLDIAIGAVYNNKKLIATKHVLICGPELALPCDAM